MWVRIRFQQDPDKPRVRGNPDLARPETGRVESGVAVAGITCKVARHHSGTSPPLVVGLRAM
jgi:hypothetical protein